MRYLLQFLHSSHLPLQQVAQSLFLQHDGQLVPAACNEPTATRATAIAVRMDFISVPFISKLLKVLSGKKPDPARFQAKFRGGGVSGFAKRGSARSFEDFQELAWKLRMGRRGGEKSAISVTLVAEAGQVRHPQELGGRTSVCLAQQHFSSVKCLWETTGGVAETTVIIGKARAAARTRPAYRKVFRTIKK